MPSGPRKLSDWLDRQTGPAQRALDQADQLVQANRALREWLREPWSSDVRIAALKGDVAVLYAANAAAATLLRFRAPSILAFIQERFHPTCTDLQIKVRPDTYVAN